MKECKYRLPCDWCDKFNKKCKEIDYYEFTFPDTNKCDHDWQVENVYAYCDDNEELRHRAKYVCRKCHSTETREVD